MSWNNTVTCSYCRERGHNRRGCSDLKEEVERRRARGGDDDWFVAQYDERVAVAKARRAQRTCSFCQGEGHDRRKCADLTARIADMHRKNLLFRSAFLNYVHELGLGPGTILGYRRWTDGDQIGVVPYMVKNIDWKVVNWHTRRDYGSKPLITSLMSNLTESWHLPLPLLEGCLLRDVYRATFLTKSLTVLSPSGGTVTPPTGWLQADKVKYKKALKPYTKWDYDGGHAF